MIRRLAVVILLGLVSPVYAQSSSVVRTFDLSSQTTRSPADYAGARALPLPRVAADPLSRPAPVPRVHRDGADASPDAGPPNLQGADRRRFAAVLFDFTHEQLLALRAATAEEPERVEGRRWGTAGLDFTSSRLIPGSAVREFPYSAVGKIFFSAGEDQFVCSGAVIAERLVLTAAHCVHGGPEEGFYTDFQFVPAYRYGSAPFGVWDVDAAFVTSTWAESGEIPHPQDWAILQTVDEDGATVRDVVGKLTYSLDRLSDNHLHLLGYPGNLDDGEQMHEVTSGDFFEFEDNTTVYGSDMGGGSSGGPWVQNFSRKAKGQPPASYPRRLAVVGVTSYGFEEPEILAQGSSVLTEDFEALLQEACSSQPGNC